MSIQIDKQPQKNDDNNAKIKQKLYTFWPCKLQGSVYIPPAKSYLHRYIIAAALAKMPLVLHNVTVLADDVKVSLAAMQQLGMDFAFDALQKKLILSPTQKPLTLSVSLDMYESGTSLRLFLPLLIHFFDAVHLTGTRRLPYRPLSPYMKAFTAAHFSKPAKANLPLHITGEITAKTYRFNKQMSSQFISGLMFTLPLLDKTSTIELTHRPLSLPYIQMTIAVLQQFGIKIRHNATYTFFSIPAPQRYIAPTNPNIAIEQDYSARAFWEVARSVKHADLIIDPKPTNTVQGDALLLDLIVQKEKIVDLSDMPDLAPILALYFSQTSGGQLNNVDVLIHKESNRLQAITDFLTQASIGFQQRQNTLIIHPGQICGNRYHTYHDHRMTMMLIIAASMATGPVILNEVRSIDKSYPTFLLDYQNLGGQMHEK